MWVPEKKEEEKIKEERYVAYAIIGRERSAI